MKKIYIFISCTSKLVLNKCNTCQFPPPSTISFDVTVHGDTYWLYQAIAPPWKHGVFFLSLFLGGRFAEVVLFCISNSLVIMSYTSFEVMAPKSQKKKSRWGEEGRRHFSQPTRYVTPNSISPSPSSLLHHLKLIFLNVVSHLLETLITASFHKSSNGLKL